MDVTAETDMTPMIDVTFQLIAFFMFVLSFSENDQDQRIKLPKSELAKPPEGRTDAPITLQLTRRGTVYYLGDEVPVSDMGRMLLRESQLLERRQQAPADANVVIRADADAQTGVVQELIQVCQETGFEKFSLRVLQTKSVVP